jgi:2,4-dienoyl-CoA reductase-like NADH-dependent reductase (Old Yellow Enzyme family)
MSADTTHVSIQSAQTRSLDDLFERLAADEFDLVAVGRALLANYNWAALVKSGDFSTIEPFQKKHLKTLY